MTRHMLIDASHNEETRVVVLDDNRLIEFDFESSTKKQIKGNVYLAKVTRVEPSLQAAFVDFGGERQGFLAFSEIHPDYYRIPVADREDLLREHAALSPDIEPLDGENVEPPLNIVEEKLDIQEAEILTNTITETPYSISDPDRFISTENAAAENIVTEDTVGSEPHTDAEIQNQKEQNEDRPRDKTRHDGTRRSNRFRLRRSRAANAQTEISVSSNVPAPEQNNHPQRQPSQRQPSQRQPSQRRYKIQEVIKRRQILLVQVVKEERGSKGAALTTYMSLAGRYCVLMPNATRGGGISRKIGGLDDRKRLKDIVSDLNIPPGMAVIVRTAGSERTKAEVRRDYDYLMRLWEEIRTTTLASSAPSLIHEEGDLIKRSIRDLYTRDIDEVLVEGNEGYKIAKAFMKTLVPSHAKRVQPYTASTIPLFHHFQVEGQLDRIFDQSVQLRSGGTIVIQATEAMVSIDVNSGRATRERHIEETALKTNLEAAEEIALQLRLRDLAGLIVIDFIDMEENRHIAQVERCLREAMKNDRARIQIGRISLFGLLELSRQRMRPSLQETTSTPCLHCQGTGFQRSVESAALRVLRAIEEEGIHSPATESTIYVPTHIALYLFNHKRKILAEIENRYAFNVILTGDDHLFQADYRLERGPNLKPEPAIRVNTDVSIEAGERKSDEESADNLNTTPSLSVTNTETANGKITHDETVNAGTGRRKRWQSSRRSGGGHANTVKAVSEGAIIVDSEKEDIINAAHNVRANGGTMMDLSANEGNGGASVQQRRRGKRGGRRRRRDEETNKGDSVSGHDKVQTEIPIPIDTQTYPIPGLESNGSPPSNPSSNPSSKPPRTRKPRIGTSQHSRQDKSAIIVASSADASLVLAPPISTSQITETSSMTLSAKDAERQQASTQESIPESVKNSTPPRRGWWQRLLK